tara:strand:+ start:2689 stop:2907 length:219 start_codon:yes stop_codon:yes gene_type:complete
MKQKCKNSLEQCENCKAEITKGKESPEKNVCGECFTYLQDLMAEEENRHIQQYVTREMAIDAGFPDMEGMPW